MSKNAKMKGKNLSRRNFIGQVSAATAAFTIIPRHVMPGKGYMQPSDTVNVAGIGIGAQGGGDIRQLCTPDVPIVTPQRQFNGQPYTKEQLAEQERQRAELAARQSVSAGPNATAGSAVQSTSSAVQLGAAGSGAVIKLANVYALCDVDPVYSAHIIKGYPKAKFYNDWRQLLEKEKSIDAVVIATPDHNHATIAAHFIKEKKHVYVEKPLAKTIFEVRKLAELAKQYNIVSQMGNQGHATEGTRKTVEWIQSGVIGQVREVNLWTDRPLGYWKQGELQRPPAMKIPKDLNYDVWLGPAPFKPYNVDTCHFMWRGMWDYGTGCMGDMGAHIFDAPIWAMNLGMPTKIQASSTPYSTDFYAAGETVTYHFPERYTPGIGYMPPVKVTWSDGGIKPERPAGLEPGREMLSAIYKGEKGVIMHTSHGANPLLVPDDPSFKGPDPWLPRTGNIFEDWIGAIKSGKKSCNDFSISSKVTEIMLLTNVAVLSQNSNQVLEYDAANMKITNYAPANNYFHYEYRQGWSL
jgi:predicted dehydrogenase